MRGVEEKTTAIRRYVNNDIYRLYSYKANSSVTHSVAVYISILFGQMKWWGAVVNFVMILL